MQNEREQPPSPLLPQRPATSRYLQKYDERYLNGNAPKTRQKTYTSTARQGSASKKVAPESSFSLCAAAASPARAE
jgi:hypothetical protein